jgi:hypothetical protein
MLPKDQLHDIPSDVVIIRQPSSSSKPTKRSVTKLTYALVGVLVLALIALVAAS